MSLAFRCIGRLFLSIYLSLSLSLALSLSDSLSVCLSLSVSHSVSLPLYNLTHRVSVSLAEDVFRETEPLVMAAMEGYNACVFAYGQTGAGKTFTMVCELLRYLVRFLFLVISSLFSSICR